MLVLAPEPDAPTLETPRLRLRGHRLADFAPCAAMWADPIVTRFIGGRPSTEEEVWARLLRYRGHWAHLGFGYWAVEEKASGAFVGELGFADFQRDLAPPFGDRPELGWALSPSVHGRGYATEALLAALRWGDARFGHLPTVCMIAPENAPSLRVAAKLGFREYLRTTYKGEPTVLLERPPLGG
jgi:RimJ/RimL family protein N-acetyltransferase